MTRPTDQEISSMLKDLAFYIENTSDTPTMCKFTRVLIYSAREMAEQLENNNV